MNNFEMVTENIIKNDAITFKNVKLRTKINNLPSF